MNILSSIDTYYSYSGSEITYVIRLGETETAVFYGRAVKAPNEDYIYIKINDIAQQYLNVIMPDFRNLDNDLTRLSNAVLPFSLYKVETYTATTEGGQEVVAAREVLLETYNVLLSYSYDEEWHGGNLVLSKPVNGHLDPRMKMVWSAYASGSTNATLTTPCPVPITTPDSGSTPSVDSGETVYSGETHMFVVTGGDGIEFNSQANTWYITYETDYLSVYYVFSASTGAVYTGYTSGGQVSFYIPPNTGSSTNTFTVTFYPFDGGADLDNAVSTQVDVEHDIDYEFTFNNPPMDYFGSANTSNYVSWETNYPYIIWEFSMNGEFQSSGSTTDSGETLSYSENYNPYSANTFTFCAFSPKNEPLGCVSWEQAMADPGVEPVTPYKDMYLTFQIISGSGILHSHKCSCPYFSKDSGETWEFSHDYPAEAGDIIFVKNNGCWHIFWGENILYNIYGNVMSALMFDDFMGKDGRDWRRRLQNLALLEYSPHFGNGVVSAENLYIPDYLNCSGTDGEGMFGNCETLTTAPAKLPKHVPEKGCLRMFYGCTSLTTAPELPATALTPYCYQYMFCKCASLTTAPALPATTLAYECCYAMFDGCTSLTAAPELPATTLAGSCYWGMFAGCTALATTPASLPATTLAAGCYAYMFDGCTSLVNAPALPAETLVSNCYIGMFRDCRALAFIQAMFTTNPVSGYPGNTPNYFGTQSWVSGIGTYGLFVKNAEATWNLVGTGAVPPGWEIQTA